MLNFELWKSAGWAFGLLLFLLLITAPFNTLFSVYYTMDLMIVKQIMIFTIKSFLFIE